MFFLNVGKMRKHKKIIKLDIYNFFFQIKNNKIIIYFFRAFFSTNH